MKNNNVLMIIILMLCSILFLNTIGIVRADSGFDASYDGGSSIGGSSGWSSSGGGYSSYDSYSSIYSSYGSYSSHYSSSSGSVSSYKSGQLIIFIFLIFFIFEIYLMFIRSKNIGNTRITPNYKPRYLTDHEIKEYIPDFNYVEFINARYKDYLDIQNAWSTFNYNALREKLTDELYNQYLLQLDTMKIKGEQNIMCNFSLVKGNITKITKTNGRLELTMELVVSFIDYIAKNGEVLRGSKKNKIMIYYEIVFVCDELAIMKCPNCHADLTDSSSQVCEYCRTIVNRTGKNWVMAKKKNIKQC